MKIKVDKDKLYKVKFEHSLDSKDTITSIVYGCGIFRLRSFLGDLGYRLVKYEVVEYGGRNYAKGVT